MSAVGALPTKATSLLFGDLDTFTKAIDAMIRDRVQWTSMGNAGRVSARQRFAAEVIVPPLYRRVCG